MIWQAVDDFIERKKNASVYDQALKHLFILRDLANFEQKGDEFNRRLLNLKETCSRRRALLERFNRIDLV